MPNFVRNIACLTALALATGPSPVWAASPAAAAPGKAAADSVGDIVFDGGLKGSWQDWGWAPRTVQAGKPAELHMSKYAGWILAHKALTGSYTALALRVKAPATINGDFLEVRLAASNDDSFPHVQLTAKHRQNTSDGWAQYRIGMAELNPTASAFDRVVLRAFRSVPDDVVLVDKIVLFEGAPEVEKLPDVAQFQGRAAPMRVECKGARVPISPLIYGIAYNAQRHNKDQYLWELGATIRRWGGNATSRYNWKLGHAWNTANDWFYMNVNYTNDDNYSWTTFLDENRNHRVKTALTIPTMGWVAKDTEAYSYPVSVFGPQQYANNDVGNGMRSGGGKVTGADPKRTSIETNPAFMADWVKAIRAYDQKTQTRNVHEYILDNEPALWNSTHRDVHPKALTYDELLKRTIDYGTAVRRADPEAVIASPAEWGWPAYFFSAQDAEVGFTIKPDRRAHGDVPLMPWYLKKLRDHARTSGTRIIDVLDLHYYPQTDGMYGRDEHTDAQSALTRVRVTRSLWDPTYEDESWIADKIRLLPRMRDMIADNYPGLKISIGEYNFGGEKHISGALAQAETLGRFAQFGVYSAFYWTYPPAGSAVFNAFRAYRNYDGQGAHFLENYVPSTAAPRTSLHVSQNDTGDSMVLVALNLDDQKVADAAIELVGCGDYKVNRAFAYSGQASGIAPLGGQVLQEKNVLKQKLLPFSINIFELKRGAVKATAK